MSINFLITPLQLKDPSGIRGKLINYSFWVGLVGILLVSLAPLASYSAIIGSSGSQPQQFVAVLLLFLVLPYVFLEIGEALLVVSLVLGIVGMLKSRYSSLSGFIPYTVLSLLSIAIAPIINSTLLANNGTNTQPLIDTATFVVALIAVPLVQVLFLLCHRIFLPVPRRNQTVPSSDKILGFTQSRLVIYILFLVVSLGLALAIPKLLIIIDGGMSANTGTVLQPSIEESTKFAPSKVPFVSYTPSYIPKGYVK